MSPWTVKDRRRRHYARVVVMLAMAVAVVGSISSAQADANSDGATAIADGLRSFSTRLNDSADALGGYQALAESLPLVDLAPGSADALRLSSLLQEQLTAGANSLDATYSSLAELESDLESLDELQEGVQFDVGDVTITGAPPGIVNVQIPVSATRHVDQPLDFAAGIASIEGGGLAIDFSLSTTLTFRLDASGGAPFPATAFSLVVPAGTPPVISVCASVDAEIDAFTARLGFTDVTLSTDDPTTPGAPEKAKLDACAKVTFTDPDSNGVLTQDEFSSHALTELAQATLVDGDTGGNDLDATLFVDASLVNGDAFATNSAADASISFTDLNLAAAPAPAVATDFGNLLDFTSITPGDIANGLSQFIAAFGGSQTAGNGAIPFVKDGLNRAFEVVKPLKDYARRLTDAEVVCGTEPGTASSMPSGSTANLRDDEFVYCRAKTAYTVSAGLTTWTSPVAAEIEKTSGAAADPTIGGTPEQNAKFQMDGDGSFEVSVAFTADPDAGGPQTAQAFTAIPRPQTAQELFDELAAAAGLDLSTSGLTYDATTKSLSYRLRGSFDPAPVGPGAENPPTWDFGDQLRNVTHLSGLQASASATTTLDAGQVDWDTTFGVILTADEADITPATGSPGLLDRFFVKVRTDPGEHEISLADLSVTGDVQLDGQVGFLGVHVAGNGTDNTFAPGNAFGVSKADATKPVVTVDINPGSGVQLDTDPGAGESLQTISGAISVADLAFHLDDTHLDAVCNLKATAGLRVSADVAGGLQTLAEAGVAVNWPQVFKPNSCTADPAGLQITPSASFNTDLFHFDPFPSVSGTATAVAANPNEGVVLIDGSTNPTPGDGNDATEFPRLGNFTNLTLRNKTTGATCIILTISAQELSCATSLSGGTRQGDLPNNNKWKIGDEYEVEGNALGMLSIILDNLDALVDQLEALGADVDATIPLVNLSTEELIAKIQSIKRTIDDLRGFPKAQVQCGLTAGGSEDVSVVPDGTTIYCRATTQNTPTAVRWTVETDPGGSAAIVTNGESGLDPDTPDVPGALTTVGPAPSTFVQFTVNDGDPAADLTTLDEWQLNLEWADAGGANTAEFPPLSPPSTLQSLEELIEDKLGITDPNVFQLDLRDLPTPGVGAVVTGAADGDSNGNTLSDEDALAGVIVGMTVIRTTNPGKGDRCSITSVSSDDAVTCVIAGGWAENDGYEVVGNGTKDLVIKLGAGFCGEAGGLTCDSTYRQTDPLSVPLNLEVGSVGDLVSVDSGNQLDLGYKAKATLELGIPLKLGIPVPTIVDTTGIELEGRAALDPIDLSAGIGPVQVSIGAAVADKDPGPDVVPGVGTAKVGAQFTFKRGDDDGIPGNRTYDFGGGNSFFTGAGGLEANFEGVDQDCGGTTTGGTNDDACLVADLSVSPGDLYLGDIVLTCDVQPLPAAPSCAAPAGLAVSNLQAAINGDPLNFALLIQLLPQLLNNLEHSLSGAAQDVELPLIGEALDAGADIVNTFNQGVVVPFAGLAAEIQAAGDTDGDTVVEPAEVAAKVQGAIFGLIGPTGSVQLGGQPADLILDLNGDGAVTVDDVSVVALCGDPAERCADGDLVSAIDDFRITVKLGKSIDTNVPFDLGLDGVPLSLQGGLHAGGGWALLLDFGLSRDGPYLVKSGPRSVTEPLAGVTGAENQVNGLAAPGTVLQDDDATFTGKVEIGSWVKNVTSPGGCRITAVESTKLHCENFVGFSGITWTEGDEYEIVALHPPDKGEPGGAAELELTAELGFGQAPAGTCATDPDALPGSPAGLVGVYSVDGTNAGEGKCLQAKVAFLTATVRDAVSGDACGGDLSTGVDPTKLCLTAFLDVTSSGSNPRITLANLGQADLTLGFSGDANVDIRFRTGVGTGADFPSVVGTFQLYWGFSGSTENAPSASSLLIEFKNLHLDAGAFVGRFLGPMVKGIQNVTKPLQPVIETLQAEVPIVSDLSKLVGEGPVTFLDLLEELSGNDLSMVRSVLQLIRFVNNLPTDSSGLLIPLGNSPGSFTVANTRALGAQPTPDQAGSGIQNAVAGTNLTDQLGSLGAGAPSDECEGRGSTFGVCGMTFPFLANATQIFGVLMGQDVTLIRYDAGTLRASAGFGYCFPPILIGPVPIEICLGGSFSVEGRFAMGYDTSGIRKVLEGGSGTALLDGIFIDDYNAAGEEVPEITFTGTVYAEGAVSVAIISVGVRGEIILTTNLDLDDRPNPDGKLRIEEIINRLSNPICLFIVSGQIDAALSAFVEIDLFFFTKRFSIEIVRITLLKFEVKCEPEVPNLADVTSGGNGLILNVGARSGNRNIQENVEDEKFVVRQMEDVTTGENAGKTRFSISAFGIKEDEYLNTAAVNAGTAVAEAHGQNGDDSFAFLAGGGNEGTANDTADVSLNEFEPKVDADGEGGNDEITSGQANDDVTGGPGNDRLLTGAGVDTIDGGSEHDSIDAGAGNDVDVVGGPGNDTMNGGPGADTMDGQADDDNMSAGPDDAAATFADTLIGSNGNDTLAGDGGPDNLFGDDQNGDCAESAETADPGITGDNMDALTGGPGNDNLHGGPERDQIEGQAGDDAICGNGGGDEILGGAGDDNATGGTGDDNITGGSDPLSGSGSDPVTEGDTLNGGSGRDYMLGDDGTLTRDGSNNVAVVFLTTFAENDTMNGGPDDDFMWGQAGADTMNGNENDDEMRGGAGIDTMNGNADDDEMYGDEDGDLMHGDAGNDLMRGGVGADTMDGDDDTDEMYGDNDADLMRGGNADDVMRGGGGDDEMEGNANTTSALPLDDPANLLNIVNTNLDLVAAAGNAYDVAGGNDGDVIYGDADQDDLIGGSQGGSPPADGGDTILGNAGQDVILGDDGDVSRPGGAEPDGTTVRSVTLTDPNAGGADFIQGNDENDDVYAGGSGDLVHGDAGDDYVEGNGGSDGDGDADTTPDSGIGLYGDAGQDDLIGGTSQGDGGVADGADDLWGGMGADVAAGDNADITRAAGTDCPAEPDASAGYDCNTFRAVDAVSVVIRRIQIWDVDTTTSDPAAGTFANDTVSGQDGHDRLYGQGGDDAVEGGGNDDFAFGNAGADVINGGDGNDDLVGGTGRTDSVTAASAVDGRIDDADLIHGDAHSDAIAGDNARMVRTTTDADTGPNLDQTGLWKTNTFNGAPERIIALMDVATVAADAQAGTSGNDQLLGDAADDVVYGQGGNDGISGGDGQDLLEGNANGAGSAPDPGGTYGAGWPAVEGDVVHGDAANDDIAGGTGRIYRMVAGVETQDPALGSDGRLDGADTLFGDGGFDEIAGDNAVIRRKLVGGLWVLNTFNGSTQHDPTVLRDVHTTASTPGPGTSGADAIHGGTEDDVAFGQGAADTVHGNDGHDYLEGNHDADTVFGDAGEDDIAGGGSANDGIIDADRVGNTLLDVGDTLYGDDNDPATAGDDGDVIAGDNARIVKTTTPAGLWVVEGNTSDFVRSVTLFDIQVAGGAAISPLTSGPDLVFGEGGRDHVFGQGNGAQPATAGDPDDDVDNDRDGRESASSTVYDCADGRGNDNAAGCTAAIDEDNPWNGDLLHGNDGDDVVEGNHGADWIFGDGGEDDLIGGSSAGPNGLVNAGVPPTHLADGNDVILGGDDDDLVLADNGRIIRTAGANGVWLRHTGFGFDLVVRTSTMTSSPERAGAFGNDHVRGEEGHDGIHGQQGDDLLEGNAGEDALNGDLGRIVNNLLGVGGDGQSDPAQRTIQCRVEEDGDICERDERYLYFEEVLFKTGRLLRTVELFLPRDTQGAVGKDTLLGGDGDDSIHGGPGADVSNGNGGEDRSFGGDGADAIWGGTEHDHAWGGHHKDYVDVLPREPRVAIVPADNPYTKKARKVPRPADSPLWFTYANGEAGLAGDDLAYGGWDQDALMGISLSPEPGKRGDRIMDAEEAFKDPDWNYNVFPTCYETNPPGWTDDGKPLGLDDDHRHFGIIDVTDDDMPVPFFQDIATSDGSFDVRRSSASGFRELAIVFENDKSANKEPAHPENPWYFVCPSGTMQIGENELPGLPQ
jgi:Ca2+-binding RTX toxin-like protein